MLKLVVVREKKCALRASVRHVVIYVIGLEGTGLGTVQRLISDGGLKRSEQVTPLVSVLTG
jgi:hypothetical protein